MHSMALRQFFFEQSLPATFKQHIIWYSYNRFASNLEHIGDMLKEYANRWGLLPTIRSIRMSVFWSLISRVSLYGNRKVSGYANRDCILHDNFLTAPDSNAQSPN